MEENQVNKQEEREVAELAAEIFGGGNDLLAPSQEDLNQVFKTNVPDIEDLLKQDRLDYLSRNPDAVERDYRAEKMRTQGFSRGPDLFFAGKPSKADNDLLSQILGARADNSIWETVVFNSGNNGSTERPKFKYRQEKTDGKE